MRSRRSRASRARPRLRSRTRSWQDLRSRMRNDEAPNRTSLVDEARLASVLRLSDGHIGRYRSTSRLAAAESLVRGARVFHAERERRALLALPEHVRGLD